MCCGQGDGCTHTAAEFGRVRALTSPDSDVYLNVFVPVLPPAPPNDSRGPVGVETPRTPPRRFSGTLRREAGPAEDLTGLVGAIGAPHRILPPDPRIPVMEPIEGTPATVVREPAIGDTGIGLRCRI